MRQMWNRALGGLLAGGLLLAGAADARDYLVVGSKPNTLFVVDVAARKVAHEFKIPGAGSPYSIAVAPDGKAAYVLTEHWQGISGIDLESGKQIFRAELSSADERVVAIGGIALSRDGTELFVQESPTRMLASEYQVEPARVAVYRTTDGLAAKPARSFEIPRRIIQLMPSTDGKILYALGWDLYALDPQDGRVLKTDKIIHWDRPNAAPPDILDVWPDYEQSDLFTTPYFYARTDVKPGEPGSLKTGLLTLDLKTGAFEMKDFEDFGALIFSSVANPVRRNEVYGVYSTLSKIDRAAGRLDRRIDMDHTYYAANVSTDGSELYAGGTMDDIAIYTTADMRKVGDIKLPGGADMAVTSMRIFHH